jgi:hypothetical protein
VQPESAAAATQPVWLSTPPGHGHRGAGLHGGDVYIAAVRADPRVRPTRPYQTSYASGPVDEELSVPATVAEIDRLKRQPRELALDGGL